MPTYYVEVRRERGNPELARVWVFKVGADRKRVVEKTLPESPVPYADARQLAYSTRLQLARTLKTTRKLTVKLPAADYERLKVAATLRDITLVDLVREALGEWLAQRSVGVIQH